MRALSLLGLLLVLAGCTTYEKYVKGQGCTDPVLSWWSQKHVPCDDSSGGPLVDPSISSKSFGVK